MPRVKVRKRTSGAPIRVAASAKSNDQTKTLILGLLLFFITVIVYIPAMSAGFIWDDDQEVTQNKLLPTAQGLHDIWINPPTADYFPLKTTMLWFEYHLWGLQPGPANGFHDTAMMQFAGSEFHTVNILLHAIDVVILWRLLLALEIPAAWFCALIFGIHPVNVESVAWISERKNTLSTLFYLLALISWVRFDRNKRWIWYIGALLGFLAALLCKTSVVIFPFIILLLAWWWRDRIKWKDIVYSAPFFALAAFLGVITMLFQNARAIGQEVIPIGGFDSRFASAGMAIWFYLSKALFPYNLMEIYPTWDHEHPTLLGTSLHPIQMGIPSGPWTSSMIIDTAILYLPSILLIALFCVLFAKRKSWGRVPLFALGYFVICVLPAIGFLKMSYMRLTLVADHFTYLSIIGMIGLVGGSFGYYCKRAEDSMKSVFYICATAVALTFVWLSWERAAVHHSEKTLWADTLNRNPDTWQGHNHYGAALFTDAGGYDNAANQEMAQANQSDPNTAARLRDAGNQYHQMAVRLRAEAKTHFADAVRLKPDNPEVHNNLGLALANEGKFDEAVVQYYIAAHIKGDDATIRSNLANTLEQANRFEEAVVQYREAIKYNQNDPTMHCNLGFALHQTGHLDEAIEEFQKSLQIDPNAVTSQQNLANALREKAAAEQAFKEQRTAPSSPAPLPASPQNK